jgi:hypothetical protein
LAVKKGIMALCAALFAGVVALIGWVIWHESVEPDHGTITKMEYSPAYTTTSTQCTSNGKTTTCVPTTQFHPECYRVVYSPNPDEWGDACVAPADWPRYRVGDQYPLSREPR